MNKFLQLFIFSILLSIKLVAQTDTVFWFAAPDITSQSTCGGPAQVPLLLQITAHSNNANVTISQPAGGFANINLLIPANTSTTYDLSSLISQIEVEPANTIVNRGIKILSDSLISVYVEYTNTCSPELYVLKGQNALGNNFFVSAQTFLSNSAYSPVPYNSFNLVSTENNNQVTITPNQNIVGHNASIPFTITLNKGQAYAGVATSQTGADHLGGSYITSTKPIAVTLSDDMLYGIQYGGCGDQAGDQTIPVSKIGNEYIAIKGGLNGPDKVYITATQNSTTVSVDGVYITTLNVGQTFEHSLNNPSTFIQTSLPSYCFQMSGLGCEVGHAILPQLNCTGSHSVSLSRTTNENLIINLVVKNGGQNSFLINGQSGIITSAQFAVVPGSSGLWYFASITLPISNYPLNGIIKIENTSQLFHMGVLQGGYTSGTSFGYFSDFNTFKAHATANNNSPCIGSQLKLFADTVFSATYTWTGPNGFTSSLQNPTINNFQAINAGNYYLQVSIAGCATSFDTLNIGVTSSPTINITTNPNPATICNGSNITLTASGANTYSWGGGISNGVSFTPTATTTYTVTGTNSFGCTKTATKLVTVNNTNNNTINQSICQGQTYLGYSTTGTYIDTFTNSNGCDSIRTLNLTVNPLPTLNITATPNDSICNGQSVTLIASGANTYSWTGGITNGVAFTPIATTTYSVTGTSSVGCTNTSSQTITIIPLPTINITTNPNPATICNGNNITLTANGANTYSWSGGITNGISFIPTATTTYTVTGTSSFGCTKTATQLITVNNTNNFIINQSICIGQSYLGYSTTGTYIDTFTNSNGCDSIRTLNLTVNSNTFSTINQTICQPNSYLGYNATGTFIDTLSNANGCDSIRTLNLIVNPKTYNSINHTICQGQNYLGYTTSGTHIDTFTNSNGCDSVRTLNLTVNPLPTISIQPTTTQICNGASITLTATGANTYVWSPSTSLNTTSNSIVVANPTTTTTYTIIGTDANNCSNSISKTLTVFNTYTQNDTATICQGSNYSFGSQTLTTAGNYTNTFSSIHGCDSIIQLNLKVIEKPIANFIVPTNICANTPIDINNTWVANTANYNWSFSGNPTINSQNGANYNVTWNTTGIKNISLTITPTLPCLPVSLNATTNVTIPFANISIANNDTIICSNDVISLKTYSNPSYLYEWNPAPYFVSNTSIVSGQIKEPMYATVMVTDTIGCTKTDSIYLNAIQCCSAYLPNAFSPNDDLINDEFKIMGFGDYQNVELLITNRWGEIVFKSTNPSIGWDGYYKSMKQEVGTYYYLLKYQCGNSEKKILKGDVTLIR